MPIRTRFALLAVVLLAACQGQAAPTITPAPTLDTTAIAGSIAANIFGTLTAQPTSTPLPSVTPSPSPTVTASYTPQPTFDAAGLAATVQAGAVEALLAQLPTAAPTLDVDALASSIQAGAVEALLEQLPTAAPTLDMPVVVSTVQVAVVETLLAQVNEQQYAQATQQAAQQATQTALDSAPADVSADDDPAIGPADAAVVIIAFSDFSCPHCANFALNTLPRLIEAYGDRVRFVFRDAPILGPTSGWAALAAECADDQGKFWEYHDLLFANQRSLSRENLTAYAQQLELDTAVFDACVDNQTHLEELQKDLADAQAVGLSGTPTFFINGRRVVGAQPFEVFVEIIEAELAQAGG